MRAHWQRSPTRLKLDTKHPLRLLLIPFPFVLEAGWFKAVDVPSDPVRGGTYPWGWFGMDQHWLDPGASEVVGMVSALLCKATETVGSVNGVILPECALNWETHKAVADALRDKYPDVEFLVSGSTTNCVAEEGNFSLSSQFFTERQGKGKVRMASTSSQAKHHRWRLERSQIESYGLQFALDPSLLWWETISLPQRNINVNVIRRASTFTTMICEDLARSEPCHDVLRALGPNLVFVLLMDGPQLPFRWSARYATGLAEDPGSSVLTFTSRGLVARANDVLRAMDPALLNGRKEDWTVALWRDSGSAPYQITCPPESHAVLLTLEGKVAKKATLDGRHNPDAVTWRRDGDAVQIALDPAEQARYAQVLGLRKAS